MANDQGKMGNIIGLSLMAEQLDKTIPQVGTTVFRPPYTPCLLYTSPSPRDVEESRMPSSA